VEFKTSPNAFKTAYIRWKIIKMDYGSIVEYNRYLNGFKRAKTLRAGYFYVYKYNFYKNYPIQELKYYDYRPLVFIFNVTNRENGKYFIGINFHHLPVKARQFWLRKLQSIAKRYFNMGGVQRIPGLNYDTLQKVMKKSIFGVRQYRANAIKDLREIPLDKLEDIMKFYAKTYYGITIREVQAKYNQFRINRKTKDSFRR
jgi:hypothetical protein